MTQPDFMIIGAMKCGTSTIAAQLGAQAGVFMTTPKEPNFFSDDRVFAKGADWYAALFSDAKPGDVRGEASTHYTKRPQHDDVIPRIQAAGLAPKLIYMIRNPLDRLVSHYIHEWTMGAISCDIAKAHSRHPELVDYSRYGFQISPWVEAFGRESILVITMEEMTRDPQSTLEKAARHIGVDHVTWREDLARLNASSERIRRLPLHNLVFDNPIATALRRKLIPQSVRDHLKSNRQMTERPVLPEEHIERLNTIFMHDRAVLEQLIGQDPNIDAIYQGIGG